MIRKSLLFTSAVLALMFETTACGLYTSGIGEDGAGGAASSSTQSGSSAQSASSGSGTSSGSGSGMEDCFDDMDNDGDNQVDCLDPSCSGVAQCSDVPKEWIPVWALESADPMAPPGTCADGKTPRAVYFTKPGGPSMCSPCMCGLAAGATCTAPPITCYYTASNCTGPVGTTQQASNTTCIDLSVVSSLPGGSNVPGSCKLTGQGNFSGMCTPSGGAEMKGPMWGGAVFVCDSSSSTGGCAAGQQCLPAGSSPDGKLCIKKDGADPCPQGWTNTISAFAGGNDARSCSTCQCSGGCTGGSYVVHDFNNCTNMDGPFTVDSVNCVATSSIFDYGNGGLKPTLATPEVASCTGGQPMGQVTTSGPVQICCK